MIRRHYSATEKRLSLTGHLSIFNSRLIISAGRYSIIKRLR